MFGARITFRQNTTIVLFRSLQPDYMSSHLKITMEHDKYEQPEQHSKGMVFRDL